MRQGILNVARERTCHNDNLALEALEVLVFDNDFTHLGLLVLI